MARKCKKVSQFHCLKRCNQVVSASCTNILLLHFFVKQSYISCDLVGYIGKRLAVEISRLTVFVLKCLPCSCMLVLFYFTSGSQQEFTYWGGRLNPSMTQNLNQPVCNPGRPCSF